MSTLAQLLQGTPYLSYTYAYPHKTAYRHFPEKIPLAELWRDENREAVFLYLHIPFCEMRCGFCNLFTTVDPAARFTAGYLEALERQAKSVREAVGDIRVVRMAFGGGTPTFLETADLARLFHIAQDYFDVQPGSIPASVEASPFTATSEKLRLLREQGIDRISLGVQSFLESEAHAAGRPQKTAQVQEALDAIRSIGFPTLNIDLIYGLPGQTIESWLRSLRMALHYRPEEFYLYPLYVRPLTGLERTGIAGSLYQDDIRLPCYRAARELLLSEGYTQISMRMFRASHAPAETGPVYCTQDDGMLGLGCGARSYTHTHHYSNEYAIGASSIRAILHAYAETPGEAFAFAQYGTLLDGEEQRRRYALKSLLEVGGLSWQDYQRRFASTLLTDLPMLQELLEYELATVEQGMMTLTPTGLERSDMIGPWLYSSSTRQLMKEWTLR